MKDQTVRDLIEALKITIKEQEDKIGWLEGFISFHYFYDDGKKHPPLPHNLKTWVVPKPKEGEKV